MPTGPKGEKRPADVVSNAVRVMQIATGEAEEEFGPDEMSEFFASLRLDRMNAEARAMISEIENPERRDQLRAQLVLKYAAIDKLLEGGSA